MTAPLLFLTPARVTQLTAGASACMDVAALQAPRHTVEQPDHDERSCQGVVDGIARVTGPVAPPSLLRVRIRAYCSTCGYHDYPAQAEVPPACPFCDQPWREVEVRR